MTPQKKGEGPTQAGIYRGRTQDSLRSGSQGGPSSDEKRRGSPGKEELRILQGLRETKVGFKLDRVSE